MPGINILSRHAAATSVQVAEFNRIQKAMHHGSGYQTENLLSTDSLLLGVTRYEEYPVTCYKQGAFTIVVEGKIYNKSDQVIRDDLLSIASDVSENGHIRDTSLKSWMLDADGDFVVVIHDKRRNNVTVFNDALGRLPVYYHFDRGILAVSREVKFICSVQKTVEFSRFALADYLLFRYPLGDNTLINDILRLPPATALRFRCESQELDVVSIHAWKLEADAVDNLSDQELADRLVQLFEDSVRQRSQSLAGFQNIVSLSGGFDSRAVLAGMGRTHTQSIGATFLDAGGACRRELPIARRITEILGVQHAVVELPEPGLDDIRRLVSLKDGLNYSAMAFILTFFEELKKTYGRKLAYWTGDGGDKVLPALAPVRAPASVEGLARMIIDKNSSFGLNEVSELLGVDKSAYEQRLAEHVGHYPEESFSAKYTHFMLFERGFKWLFEGEDRNRYFFWTVAPFYSIEFIKFAMRVPQQRKRHYRLYAKFLERLNADCAKVKHDKWKFRITSALSPLEFFAYDFVMAKGSSAFKRTLKTVLSGKDSARHCRDGDRVLKENLLRIVGGSKVVREYLDPHKTEETIAGSLNETKLHSLATVLIYMNQVEDAVAQ